MVRVPVCHTGGRGFEPRQPRLNAECRMQNSKLRIQLCILHSEICILNSVALVVKLVDTPS